MPEMVLGKRNQLRQQVGLLFKVYNKPWIEVYMQEEYPLI